MSVRELLFPGITCGGYGVMETEYGEGTNAVKNYTTGRGGAAPKSSWAILCILGDTSDRASPTYFFFSGAANLWFCFVVCTQSSEFCSRPVVHVINDDTSIRVFFSDRRASSTATNLNIFGRLAALASARPRQRRPSQLWSPRWHLGPVAMFREIEW
jgi:hypothetical protein